MTIPLCREDIITNHCHIFNIPYAYMYGQIETVFVGLPGSSILHTHSVSIKIDPAIY